MEFNIQRLTHLIRKDFLEIILKTIAIIALIFFVITTINLVIAGIGPNQGDQYDIFNTWLIMFFISCSIVGSISFEEINKRYGRIEYLSLPASSLEKISSKIINVAIIFPILMIVLYYLIYGYASGINNMFGEFITLNNQPDEKQYILYTVGAIITAFFAYGSIKYNTASFPKIIVWGLAFAGMFAAIMFIYAFIMFEPLRAEILGYGHPPNQQVRTADNVENHWVLSFAKKLFYFVPIIFWTLSYFTLKEKEA